MHNASKTTYRQRLSDCLKVITVKFQTGVAFKNNVNPASRYCALKRHKIC